ncbi:MAG: zinc ribbon domain-containing protein [Candidatus Limnocylindrales bacterium]|nr:zinc ribbon domain-containing protein [Candidatus Limnocylindrales bacterium]
MPIYDYVCGSCGHRFEVLRGINEAGPHQCPECGGPVARAFAPPTIHFKGSGWAKTDRRATSAPVRRGDNATPSSRDSSSGEESAGQAVPPRDETPGEATPGDPGPASTSASSDADA